jgi:TonB family protein
VLLNFLVDQSGNVAEITIERSSGHPRLDEAARSALQHCRFRPAIVDGKPVSGRAPIEYVWALKEPEALKPPALIAGSCKKPDYPAESRRENASGIVQLNFLVDPDGNAVISRIGKSSGYPRLDEAARAALQTCKFQPATLDAKATSAWAAIDYVWALRAGEGTIDDPTMGGFYPTRLRLRETPGTASTSTTPDNRSPQLLLGSCQKPEYPAEARSAGESGSVQLKFLVDENGEVVESAVERSSGYQRLDETARAALRRCKFEPGMQDGKPRKTWTRVQYEWTLTEESRLRTPPVIEAGSCQKPPYPTAARRANETGSVVLNLLIDEAGKVISRKIERSSGYQRLDEAAAAGLSLCSFAPATVDGRPTRAWARMHYVFRLE